MKSKILSKLFFILNIFFKIKNFNKPKMLVYSDSRGYNVISKYGKTPFDSYVYKLCKNFRVDYFICTEKFTTIVDFIEKSKKVDLLKYDVILLHCGVVDFSPRPKSNILKVKESKNNSQVFQKLFSENENYHNTKFEEKYFNEDTITIYSKEYLEKIINPQIQKISNLIWIDSNNFVKGWEGNFTKGRPENINKVVNEFDETFAKSIKNRITLKKWTDEEIKKFTIDNIHFNKNGFDEIYKYIQLKLAVMIKH